MEQNVPPHGTKCSTPWNKQEGAASVGRRCRLRGSKVPPSRGEGTGFKGFGAPCTLFFQEKKGEGESFCNVSPKKYVSLWHQPINKKDR